MDSDQIDSGHASMVRVNYAASILTLRIEKPLFQLRCCLVEIERTVVLLEAATRQWKRDGDDAGGEDEMVKICFK